MPSSTMTPSSGGVPLTIAKMPSASRTSRASACATRHAHPGASMTPLWLLRAKGSQTSAPSASRRSTNSGSSRARCWAENP